VLVHDNKAITLYSTYTYKYNWRVDRKVKQLHMCAWLCVCACVRSVRYLPANVYTTELMVRYK